MYRVFSNLEKTELFNSSLSSYQLHKKRHGVYYHNDKQKKIAEDIISSYGKLCVTECEAAVKFYEAEDYHQQYLLKGGQSAKKNAKETIRCYG